MDKENKTRSTVAGVILVGCMFIGIGLGFLFKEIPTGLFIGMGVGFIGMGIAYAVVRPK